MILYHDRNVYPLCGYKMRLSAGEWLALPRPLASRLQLVRLQLCASAPAEQISQ